MAALLLTLAAGPVGAVELERVDIDRAAELLAAEDDLVVLDVRTPGEFEAIHIAAARNIDIDGEDFRARVATLDRETPYLVHCAAGIPGGRSERSVEILQELGFAEIYHLEGGINAWKNAGRKVEGTAAE